MNKAKVIIPSLALMCFSAIACVTGSVAWFSSATNVHVGTSSFSVKALEGNMKVTVLDGVGTVATLAEAKPANEVTDDEGNHIGYKDSDNIIVKPGKFTGEKGEEDNHLTHGSFDGTTKGAWVVDPFFNPESPTYQSVGDGNLKKATESTYWASGTEGYYHIFSWDMIFTYDFGGAAEGTVNIYFDYRTSTANRTSEPTEGKDTAKGFRLAFVNLDTAKWVVWSPFQGTDVSQTGTDKPSNYVTSTTGTTPYQTGNTGNLIYKDDPIPANTGASASSTRKDCIGQFIAGASGSTQVKIKAIAWFEGEDSNVITSSSTVMNSVSTSMNFILKSDATAPAPGE